MRLSDRHRRIVEEMEADGYVWLSHLSVNAQMRFRNKTRKGFKGFLKVEGLTFMTSRVAEMIENGCKPKEAQRRLTYREQIAIMEKRLVELEAEVYRLKGVGAKHEIMRYRADEEE